MADAALSPDITLSRALVEPSLFGKVFASPSFWTWKVVGKLIDGVPLIESREIELFEQCTGRTYNTEARRAARRLILLAGRRAGKDRFLSAVACWRAALCADWRKHISAGEQAVVILLGADKKQASILRRYCQGLLATPLLEREVVRTTGEVTEFRNGSSLEIATNDARLVRGRSAIAVLGSECCHWRTDEHAASSDEEVVGAAEPSMAMCPDGGLLLLGSSVHRKRGYMHRQFKKLHGNDDSDGLCWFAPSHVMNPQLPQHVIDRALAEDKPKAAAEYLNVWREDIADFLPLDVIEAATDWGVHERPPLPGMYYIAYADPAGGTGKDSFTLAIVHIENDEARSVVVDLIRERKPRFVAAEVIREYADILRSYGISSVWSDRFGGGLTSDDWARNGVTFKAPAQDTSGNYLRALPMLTSRRGHLLDNGTLRTQLAGLERRVVGGHEVVGHPQVASAHDDVATAVCGAMVMAARLAAAQRRVPHAMPIMVGGERPRYFPGSSPPTGEVAVIWAPPSAEVAEADAQQAAAEPTPSPPTPPQGPQPPPPCSDEERKARVAAINATRPPPEYLADYQRQNEHWRPWTAWLVNRYGGGGYGGG